MHTNIHAHKAQYTHTNVQTNICTHTCVYIHNRHVYKQITVGILVN